MESNSSEKQSENLLDGTLVELIGNRQRPEILPEKYFVKKYNTLYNRFTYRVPMNHSSIAKVISALFEKFKLTESAHIFKSEEMNKGDEEINLVDSSYLIEIRHGILLFANNNCEYNILYDTKINFSEIKEILTVIKEIEEVKISQPKFSMVIQHSNGGFGLKSFDFDHLEIDLHTNYNDDFLKVHYIISDFIKNDNETGIVLLHGKYGTGKTNYLRNLISNSDKLFIFLPNELVDAIASPRFLPFISDHKNSVIVLEDCDDLLKPRQSSNGKNQGIVNLLNLSDGLLGNALSLKVVCTFNSNLKNIDEAILRKGRLVARYEFQELSTEKSQILSDKLGFKNELKEPMTLADIYNQGKENFGVNTSKQKLGFTTTHEG